MNNKWTALPRKALEPLAGFFDAEPGASITGIYEGFFETDSGAIHKVRVTEQTSVTDKESIISVDPGKLVGVSEKAALKGLRELTAGTHEIRVTYQGKKDIGKGRMAWDVEVLTRPLPAKEQSALPF